MRKEKLAVTRATRVVNKVPAVDKKRDGLGHNKQEYYRPNQTARDDAEFLPEAKVFFLSAQPDKPHALIEGTAHFLLIVTHFIPRSNFCCAFNGRRNRVHSPAGRFREPR